MPGAEAEADFFLALLQTFIACSWGRFFLFAFWPKFTCLLSLHFSQLFCKTYPAQFYRNYPTCGPTWGYSFFPKFTCLLRVNYLLVLFVQNYPAQGWSRSRFFSGFFTDIHLPAAEADFFDLLFYWNLLGCWGCIFLGFFVKNTLPGFTEINLPMAHPEATAFPQYLPAHRGWIIYWLF